jgi:hypothetical protein
MGNTEPDGEWLMRAEPDGVSLLDAASLLMRNDILPALPADKRHGALMILKAMSIAGTQLKDGDLPMQQELKMLDALSEMKGDTVLSDGDALQMELTALNRELVSLIRDGNADEGTQMHDAVFSVLRRMTKQRVMESNPKILDAASTAT